MSRIRRGRLVAAVAVAALALAACSHNSNASPTSSGDPIPIGWIGPLTGPATHVGYSLDGVRAAVKAINSAGGVKGRPLKIVSCDDQFDPNKAADCGRKMARSKVVAVVAAESGLGDRFTPVLEAARIPSVGAIAASVSENKSKLSFPIGSGTAGEVLGQGVLAGKIGCTKVAVAYADVVAAKYVAQGWFAAGLKLVDLKIDKEVPIPPTATDLNTYAEAMAASGADCVAFVINAANAQRLAQAVHKNHPAIKVLMSGANIGPQAIKALGADAEDMYVVGGFALPASDTQNATIAQFNKEVDALGTKEDRNEVMVEAWSATHLLANVLATMSSVDSSGLVSALKAAGPQDLGGAVVPFNWANLVTLVSGARTFGSSVFYSQIKNGVQQALLNGKPADLSQPASIASLA